MFRQDIKSREYSCWEVIPLLPFRSDCYSVTQSTLSNVMTFGREVAEMIEVKSLVIMIFLKGDTEEKYLEVFP